MMLTLQPRPSLEPSLALAANAEVDDAMEALFACGSEDIADRPCGPGASLHARKLGIRMLGSVTSGRALERLDSEEVCDDEMALGIAIARTDRALRVHGIKSPVLVDALDRLAAVCATSPLMVDVEEEATELLAKIAAKKPPSQELIEDALGQLDSCFKFGPNLIYEGNFLTSRDTDQLMEAERVLVGRARDSLAPLVS